jgi:nicotinate-nucleotide adenylyltransferase
MEDKMKKYSADITLVDIPDIEISSTDIRKRILNGETIKYLVPDEVEAYIRLKGLYSNGINEDV